MEQTGFCMAFLQKTHLESLNFAVAGTFALQRDCKIKTINTDKATPIDGLCSSITTQLTEKTDENFNS